MDFKKNVAAQPQVPRRSEEAPVNGPGHFHPQARMEHRRHPGKVIGLIIALVIAAALAVGACLMFAMKDKGLVGIKADQYQAVFLTNGQVYFGKLSNSSESQVKIDHIYYLQVQQSVQPADAKKQNQVSLAKLGEELHGPEDTMFISKQQVLFWENLKDNSKVVQAIKNAKN
jgi:hypothetical protein